MMSCDSTAELIDVDAFTDDTIESIQSKALGKLSCLEIIFPVTIQFVDETTAEVESYENLFETIVAFYEASEIEPSKENIPSLVFPIEVLDESGEIVSVASTDELKELKKECPRSGKSKGRKGKGYSCFSLVFPVTVSIDSTDVTFDSKSELREAIKAYKEEVGEDFEKPSLVYPVTVELEDGSLSEITSSEMLEELKDSCSEE